MEAEDKKFNYKILLTALVAVIVGVLIAFYYSYAQSKTEIDFLEQQKELLVKDMSVMRAELTQLKGENEVYEIDLEKSRYTIQQLMDSVGQLNFNMGKLRESRKVYTALKAKYDSLVLKNNLTQYNNGLLAEKYEATRQQLQELRNQSTSLAQAEAEQRERIQELNKELRQKSYLKVLDAQGSAYRMRGERASRSNKASTIEKLRGCVTISGNPNDNGEEKVLYLQFLDPDMQVIEDDFTTVTVGGNTYSRKVQFVYSTDNLEFCDYITVPEESLQPGTYTLNVFENERLLFNKTFELK